MVIHKKKVEGQNQGTLGLLLFSIKFAADRPNFAQTVKTKGRDEPFYFRRNFCISKCRSVYEVLSHFYFSLF